MLVRILSLIILFVAVLLVIAALRPAAFKVERSIVVQAPPEVVFAQVNDLQNWKAWSPWEKKDPNAKQAYEGPTAGKGAVMSWKGNRDVGEGRMTIIDSQPPKLVRLDLEFFKPMKATNLVEFGFTPAAKQTAVKWTMSGNSPLIGRLICMFVSMDKMVGKDFENGLAQLKAVAEAAKK